MTFFDKHEAAKLTVIPPDNAIIEKIEITQSWVVVNAPFWADIGYRKLPIAYSRDVPIAATDGYWCILNPDTFFKYTMLEQVFIICHEILHYVYNDVNMMHVWRGTGVVHIRPGVTLPYNDDLMGQAEDYRINAMLIASNIGKFNRDWLFDKTLSEKGFETGVEVYEKLYKRKEEQDKKGGQPQRPERGGMPGPTGKGPAQFDKHLSPGQVQGHDPDKVVERSSEEERQVAIAQAMQAAESMGQLPANLKNKLGEILDPVVDWQDKIRSTLFRRLHGDGYDWSYPDKRMIVRDRLGPYQPIFFARNTNYGCGEMVIGVDTSGSCVSKVGKFFAEMQGIVSAVNPQRLIVLWCDAAVARTDELEEVEDLENLHADIKHKGVPGGGGTDFRPVFDEVKEMGLEPECLVYFTDTEGSFPKKAPDYPVIWASIKKNGKVPWGDFVHVEL